MATAFLTKISNTTGEDLVFTQHDNRRPSVVGGGGITVNGRYFRSVHSAFPLPLGQPFTLHRNSTIHVRDFGIPFKTTGWLSVKRPNGIEARFISAPDQGDWFQDFVHTEIWNNGRRGRNLTSVPIGPVNSGAWVVAEMEIGGDVFKVREISSHDQLKPTWEWISKKAAELAMKFIEEYIKSEAKGLSTKTYEEDMDPPDLDIYYRDPSEGR
jgi:hypothetical protein